MRSDLPSGTVTFLFTDVEGSTRLLSELGADAYGQALADHRAIVREACASEGGVEVDTQGDAFFFAFPTARGALTAASLLTQALSSTLIRVRVGLHTGTPLLGEEGYVGEDVHRAARIAAAGHGGQVLVSSSTAPLVDAEALVDLGEHRFKDLAAPERVFQLGEREFPALKSLYRTNLPVPVTPFLGRERELAEVVALLRRPHVRLLTLTGPGGTGKTRLALQAAAEVADDFPDGVNWVGLASLRQPELVLPSAAQALDARQELAAHIADKRLLLLFDNFEQVSAAASDVVSLLASCPRLKLVVTTRHTLRLQAEVEYPVPQLTSDEGIELFCSRAGIEPSDSVAELCSRLDNLPLALELAAARAKLLSPEQLVERLSDRLDLLKGSRDSDARQRTLRATIEWSYELLAPDEKVLLARLSVFAGGSTLEAAEEVAEADVDTLESLLDQSLVRRRDTDLGPRFWLLETIREFAAERLRAARESEDLRQRHAEWVLELSERAESGMEGPEAAAWLARLEQEQDNLRAAFTFMEETGRSGMHLDLAGRIWEFWDHIGAFVEGQRWAEAALARSGPERDARRAKALRAAATCVVRVGDLALAKARADESLSIFRELGDAKHTAWALNICGLVSHLLGDDAQAEHLFEESRVEAHAAGADRVAAFATLNLADQSLTRGDFSTARRLSEEALELFRGIEDERESAWALHNLAYSLLGSGDDRKAVDAARESLMVSGDVWVRVATLVVLGSVAERRGEPETAARLLGATAAAKQRMSMPLSGAENELYGTLVNELAETLGQDRYEAAFAEGEVMTMDDAVAYAIENLE